ncbi:MAG TPA: hypothetical protein VFW27_03480 [Actinoplanes sp.]|nr:hypothetical protein [Actinoplanes sp.]
MSDQGQRYEVVFRATGEVRDADGNLISSEPIETTFTVNEAEARALGYNPEGEPS